MHVSLSIAIPEVQRHEGEQVARSKEAKRNATNMRNSTYIHICMYIPMYIYYVHIYYMYIYNVYIYICICMHM